MASVGLSKRMQRLASKVAQGNRLADIGTDHGYIPIALVQNKRIPSAIAMDVNQGPLKRAQEHIQAYGLDTYIETRLSDGLKKLEADEADTVLIAGMGGALTVRILEEGKHCLDTVSELVLQPQSEIYLVRCWLKQNGFRILEEDIVQEDGKYYPVIRAAHGQSQGMSEAELAYGAVALQRSLAVLQEYLQAKLLKDQNIMELLGKSGNGAAARRQEIAGDMERIRQIMTKIRQEECQRRMI